jgi:RNAse (barnase) inhibitor barstar
MAEPKHKLTYTIDGSEIGALEEFYDAISEILIPGAAWGRNLDAFNDILRGGFGTPPEGFTLVWQNSAASRVALDYPETLRWLQVKLTRCHPTSREHVRSEIEIARRSEGETLFDILVEIIRRHGPGGGESEDEVELELA